VKKLANEIKALKGAEAADKILVAGIFGWPRKGTASSTYKIDQTPNPNSADTAHPQIWDYWPVCYDPNHLPKSSGFDADAWGFGAQGGLRLSAFVDEFGPNGQKYSICEPDFTDAMKGIGDALAKKMQNLCVPSVVALGKTCTANYFRPVLNSQTNTLDYVKDASPIPQCTGTVSAAVPPPATCFTIASDAVRCPGDQSLVQVYRSASETATGPLVEGTNLGVTCQ
jgi:hypothetical protein